MGAVWHSGEWRAKQRRAPLRRARRLPSLIGAVVWGLFLAYPGATALATERECKAVDEQQDTAADALWQRLTGREDKRRPLEPWCMDIAGHPLTAGGEYEISLDRSRRLGDAGQRPLERGVLLQGLGLEAFYTLGPPVSLFAQVQVKKEKDLGARTAETASDYIVERGEMWFYSEDIAGSGVSVDLGRLQFEDERRWWWDHELDAIRVAYETKTFDVSLALAQELAPRRSDRSHLDPEHERVLRIIGEASWNWSAAHALQLFLLLHNDRSYTELPGQVVSAVREDPSDARLTWFGARLLGTFVYPSGGALGYWFDAARVRGRERLVEFDVLTPQQRVATQQTQHDVRGWAVDAGINWLFPLAWKPRLFTGYAFGSGDPTPKDGTDRSFRQTGIHANQAGFGGVQRFNHYGVLLDPELSNLAVRTVGAGLSLARSSSLDLVYHDYRLDNPNSPLRNARLDFTPTGTSSNFGQEVGLVIALEEWERVEIEFVASVFQAGRSFGSERGRRSYGSFFTVRYVF